ncbi:MAG: cobalt-precorrin 5A hydrolase [Bacillota bacterium]
MKLAVVALTNQGAKLGHKLKEELASDQVELYLPAKLEESGAAKAFDQKLRQLIGELFSKYEGLILIMALGIVVRVLAPYLEDKRYDPAVITIDETGEHVISTLSGHLGGANRLTLRLANQLQANPVVTTATDCQNKLAFDTLAQELNCQLQPFENLKLANAALVNDKPINLFTALELEYDLADNITLFSLEQLDLVDSAELEGFPVAITSRKLELTEPYLQLIPQDIIVGIGCRRGVSSKQIKEAVLAALDELSLEQSAIRELATIDLKQDEPGINQFASEWELPVRIIARERIKSSDLEYTTSKFVKEQIGVGGVCEPAAMLSVENPKVLLRKRSYNQVTVAVVQENSM